jgi:hypothetical protein
MSGQVSAELRTFSYAVVGYTRENPTFARALSRLLYGGGDQPDSIGWRVTEFWTVADHSWGVVITCRGHDKTNTVRPAVIAFEHVAMARDGAFMIYADLLEMTGYESESRQAWQVAIGRYAHRVDGLVLVGAQSALIRMGAATIGASTGIPVRFVAAWAELPEAR